MYRRDYIQRMLEEFGKMLGHVMGLKSMNLHQQAMDELRDGYKTYFGLDAAFLEKLHPDEFLSTILAKAELKNAQLEALASALMAEGELLHTINPVEANDRRRKALMLYKHLEETDTATFSVARKDALRELRGILGE